VAQPFNEMGELAVRRILSEIQGELTEEVKIEGRIILRKSTDEEA
jgi:DNA-binding LacI/PurR family transcriptional regulator